MNPFFKTAGAAVLVFGAAHAGAIIESLPPTQFDYAIQIFGQDKGVNYNTTTSYSGTLLGSSASTSQVCHPGNDTDPGGACATIVVGTHPSPSVTSFLATPPGTIYNPASYSSGDAGYQNILQATLTYYYEIVGPVAGPVPVVLDTHVKFDVNSAAATGSSHTILEGVDPGTLNTVTTSGLAYGALPDANYVLSTSAIPGKAYFIELSTGVNVDNAYGVFFGNPTITANMLADPVLSFAPGFDSTGYSIVFSDGIGNSPSAAVPEPASLGLLVAGMGLVWLRRRAS